MAEVYASRSSARAARSARANARVSSSSRPPRGRPQSSSAAADPSPLLRLRLRPRDPRGTFPPIVQAGAPALRARAEEVPVERIATPEIQELVDDDDRGDARGARASASPRRRSASASQVIVLEDARGLDGEAHAARARRARARRRIRSQVLVNPVLTPIGDERATFFEGCLSVKGYIGAGGAGREVEVTGLDEHGDAVALRVRGWPARILQHEVDHLDGTLYVDRMLTRSFSTADQAKALYGGKPIAEVRADARPLRGLALTERSRERTRQRSPSTLGMRSVTGSSSQSTVCIVGRPGD